MVELEDWLKASEQAVFQKWGRRLIELGPSWDTFRREKNGVINDLVAGGIPRLAAVDIFNLIEDEVNRTKSPMAIFWDLDLMQMPPLVRYMDIAARLKMVLRPHGNLIQFRGYTLNLSSIPANNRAELQLAGCDLIDTTDVYESTVHSHTIVDAMNFAFANTERATLCFVTSKIDKYLLANLYGKNVRTVVISDQPSQFNLGTKNNVIMKWDTDILQLRNSPPPGFKFPGPIGEKVESKPRHEIHAQQTSAFSRPAIGNKIPMNGETTTVLIPAKYQGPPMSVQNVKLLRSVIISNAHVGHDGDGTLKCQVGSVLRTTYSNLFPNRTSVQEFLTKAIDENIIVEIDSSGKKILYLTEDRENANAAVSPIRLSISMPIPYSAVPQRVKEVSQTLPIIVFLQKVKIPARSKFPDKTFVQAIEKYIILMYRNLDDLQRAASLKPWILASGIVVDWHRIGDGPPPRKVGSEPVATIETFNCHCCTGKFPVTESFAFPGNLQQTCRSCYITSDAWTEAERSSGIDKVILMLNELATCDDVYVRSSLLRRLVAERWPKECASRGQAALWIHEATKEGHAKEVKEKLTSPKKVKVVFLTKNFGWLTEHHPDVTTPLEEKFVNDLLWEKGPCSKREIIREVQSNFSRMNNPLMRNRLFMNATANGSFFVAKGPFDQIVALSQADAAAALDNKIVDKIGNQEDSKIQSSLVQIQDNESSSHDSETFDIEKFLFTAARP
jgi:hypothetical protein